MREVDLKQFDYLAHYETDAEAFDYFEARTGATAHSERRLREYILSLIPKTAESILDVGCGSAWVAKAFQHSAKFICSLDVSTVNTGKALERYPSPNHVAVVADTYHLPFKSDSFDVLVAAEIIEHLVSPREFVSELMRVVKPGGAVIISTPYKEKLRYEVCIHCNQATPHNAHLHSFDERKLASLFDPEALDALSWSAFNNKLLLFARTYPVLGLLPFAGWKLFDRVANALFDKPVNIVLKATKKPQ